MLDGSVKKLWTVFPLFYNAKCSSFRARVNLFEKSHIIIPINIRYVHYYLVLVYIKEEQIYYCDSNGKIIRETVTVFKDIVATMCDEASQIKTKNPVELQKVFEINRVESQAITEDLAYLYETSSNLLNEEQGLYLKNLLLKHRNMFA